MTTTQLVIINQTISDSFYDWVVNFAQAHGVVELWTGNPPNDLHHAVRVRRLPKYNRKSARTRLITWLQFTLVAAWLLIFASRRVPVFSITNPPLMLLVLAVYRKLFGRRYALLEYDIYPQVMSKMGIIGERNIVHKLWYRWHGWALKKADAVITISDVMALELKAMMRGNDIKISIVPTWTDTDRLKPLLKSENPFVVEHQLEDKLVVLYSGNLGATHAIETILDVAEKLQANSKIQFVIIGEGAKKRLIEDYISQSSIKNILLLPLQPREQLPYSLSSGDIAFVTLAEGYERLSMPSKTYDMMAVGSAILGISAPSSSLESVITSHHCGVSFSPHQAEEIAVWIEILAENADMLANLQKESRYAAENHFSALICQQNLTDVIINNLIQ